MSSANLAPGIDDMITLVYNAKRDGQSEGIQPGWRRVFFSSEVNIARALGHVSPFLLNSELRATAPTFVPMVLRSQNASSSTDAGPMLSPTNADVTEISRGGADPVVVPETDENMTLTKEKLRAASVIAKHYKRLLSLRNPRALIQIKFAECLTHFKTVEWPSRLYPLLYLGMVPHVLVCLDRVYEHALSTKRELRAQWKKHTGHEDLERVGERRTAIR